MSSKSLVSHEDASQGPIAQCDLFDAPIVLDDPERLISIQDMPPYRDELIALVDTSIGAVPADVIWFTYRDIRRFFGISKATIARRLQDGLVPGVRISADQVLADGNVRRFDRTQLRWLLLAVRFGRSLPANTHDGSRE